MSKNESDQTGLWTLKLTVIKKQLIELTDFLHCGTISYKLKIIKNFWAEHGKE